MKIGSYETHPAADIFPLLPESRLTELICDVQANGLHEPITLCDGRVLDGRNRLLACEAAHVTPRFRQFTDGDPYSYVWSLNGERRDIDPGQRAAIRLRADKGSSEWQREQDKRKRSANEKRSKKQVGQSKQQLRERSLSPDKTRSSVDASHEDLAKRAGVSEATAARVQALANSRPDLLEQVADGGMGLAEASRQAKRDSVCDRAAALPDGKYRVIYADPPWRYGDSRTGLDVHSSAAADQYPTMKTSDICALDVKALAADDSVLFCWATFPMLTDALEVVRAWGFKYKTAFVWDKERANLGNYHKANAELLLVCTRGSCTPDSDTRPSQVHTIKRTGRHSEKPEDFRRLIDGMYLHGPRVELFRRGDAPGDWVTWGNEAGVAA